MEKHDEILVRRATSGNLEPVTGEQVRFFVWSGWMRRTEQKLIPEEYQDRVAHTACLMLLAGF